MERAPLMHMIAARSRRMRDDIGSSPWCAADPGSVLVLSLVAVEPAGYSVMFVTCGGVSDDLQGRPI